MDANLELTHQMMLLLLAVGELCVILVIVCLLGAALAAEVAKLTKRVETLYQLGKFPATWGEMWDATPGIKYPSGPLLPDGEYEVHIPSDHSVLGGK